MRTRGIAWAVLLAFAGILSACVSLYGILATIRIDLRQDTALCLLYCGLPVLCFPVFLLVRPRSRSAVLLSLMALTYLGAYSALNWRTCSELGYCEDVIATVMQTLQHEHRPGIFCSCSSHSHHGACGLSRIALAAEPVVIPKCVPTAPPQSSGRGSISAEYDHAPSPLRRSDAAADSSGSP